MKDANTIAIAEVLRRWHDNEPDTTNVIPFPSPSQRLARESRRWMSNYTRPFAPQDPRPAA